jgi:sulfoxide reductase heme-binding subunit YedZ
MRVRRALGLYAFLYVSVHFFVFAAWDYGFDLRLLGPAIFSQRFVLPGLVAGLLLLSLAITSTRRFQRRMGSKWKRLHRLAYVAAALAVLHFFWLVKDTRRPLLYGAVLALLLLVRLPIVRRAFIKLRRRLSADAFRTQSLPTLETNEDLTATRP